MKALVSGTLILGLLFAAAPVRAGLYEDLFRGLDLLATPSGGPISVGSDGMRFNGGRNGRLRIMPDRMGRGYTLEFDRTFGGDTRGRPEVLDFGALELQLSGGVQGTFGYTSRGWLIGNADLSVNNLNYAWRTKTGAQAIEWIGTLSLQQSLEVNQFGFYSGTVSVSNSNSQVVADGLLLDDDLATNFDIGPIAVEGNVLFDGFVAVLASLGVDTTPLEGIFPRSPIDRIADAIQERLRQEADTLVAGATASADDFVGPPRPITPAELGLSALTGTSAAVSGSPSADDGRVNLPEPGTLLLVGLGTAVTLARRRR